MKSALRPVTAALRSGTAPSRAFASASSRLATAPTGQGQKAARRPQYNNASVDAEVLAGKSFLPKANIDRLLEWQLGLWERLAAEVRTNPGLQPVKQKWEQSGLDIVHLLTIAARDPALGLAFNYGSLLLNNSFFLEGISSEPVRHPESWGADVTESLRAKVEGYSEGIVGGGWLWLVRNGNSHADLDIIPTFAAGTLLVSQRAQLGREDLPVLLEPPSPSATHTPAPAASESESSPPAAAAAESTSSSPSSPSSPPLNEATRERQARAQAKAQEQAAAKRAASAPQNPLVPIAALNLFELAWLGDKYGVWAKRQYALDWFDHINISRSSLRGRA